MIRWLTLVLFLVLFPGLRAQEGDVVLRGRVSCEGRGVPYATLQLVGTSVGVACNDDGEYELKLRAVRDADTVLVRSMGHVSVRRSVGDLRRSAHIRLQANATELREVQVRSFRSGKYLLQAAVDSIGRRCQPHMAYSTFFYRDWRALNGEIYLFDEAVMRLQRAGYQKYSEKKAYRFQQDRREMASNYKTLLRHRLVVYDRTQLQQALHDTLGIDQQLAFDDNESFYDPVATPQASYSLASRVLGWHRFEPVQEFVADGVGYFLVRSIGPSSSPKAKMHYEWVIRKDNLAFVRLTAVQVPTLEFSPDEPWVNVDLDHIQVERDSSTWVYDLRDGAYTLTHYYHAMEFTLGTKPARDYRPVQRWQQVSEWTLTDFSLQADSTQQGTMIEVRPQTLAGAFGQSDYSSAYWGHYNSIPLDVLPAKLLEDKLLKLRK